MIEGRFVPLAEDWNCDECAHAIAATMSAFIFERGQDRGRCVCVQCIIDPDTDGGGEFLAAWKAYEGYSPAYDSPLSALVPIASGLPPRDNSDDDRGNRAQDSSHTLLQRYK